MVVGPSGAGKTTLLTALGLMEQKHGGKTEMVSYTSRSIDTPGEMLENPRYYSVLLMNAPKAALVLFVADPTGNVRFPSRMAHREMMPFFREAYQPFLCHASRTEVPARKTITISPFRDRTP